ncbi:hypothetical protein [Corynebacterium pseudodiphtheriticum]|uniref:hypothetical protein n=1 Tax=Corynebacterium pseudodiphtheriticum TaxID=37637 RepID=UPI002543C924|nr:hypothetical protein [Corynebacterium pseudodiphtheriticum]MDK4207000.1 hypothetical protein [Corynebacterium pseudodiphtheriticum]MDK4250259.1 hypothetical protein [Corynebacterium pseudodiphtheriticum]MDK4284345.1 hypothetical protein [Corynebacterium pseudodiphtheriticum]MDK4288826.1 hypothetical protein [Corynebacterium pseudodiphtheriticum]MDK8396697.1 hypothetical protein [Corynebacterium pseudodiphtheriticum]
MGCHSDPTPPRWRVATILDEAQDRLSKRDMQLLREHAQTNFYDAAAPDSSQHT